MKENNRIEFKRQLNYYDKSIFKLSDNFLEICFPFEPGFINTNTEQVTEQVRNQWLIVNC